MKQDEFNFTRIDPSGQKSRTTDLGELLSSPEISKETWLFVSPHDDDLAVGAALLMQAAVRAGVNVQVLVVTDGRQGYCTPQQKDTIVHIRRAEMLESFNILGLSLRAVQTIGYPDDDLVSFQGRRASTNPYEPSIAGHVGLQNAFTYYLRLIHPQRVFVPTPTDLHPDHQITYNELAISLFHASGAIWPELGEWINFVPKLYQLAVYCDFVEQPNIEIRSSDEIFQNKLKSIAVYRSQMQIASLVNSVRNAGAYEYVSEVKFQLYSSDTYKARFA